MKEQRILKNLLQFSVPFLVASFLQTFYGLADLLITGQFNGAESITAVSVGSQVLHMITVIVVGLSVGTTVLISRSIGSGDKKQAAMAIGGGLKVFLVLAVVLTAGLFVLIEGILAVLQTPPEALAETRAYLFVCFAGVPFIVAFNAASAIFRGLGDTVRPMYCVALSGVINIALDYWLIGHYGMGAKGAALGTIIAQSCSVVFAVILLLKKDIPFSREALFSSGDFIRQTLSIGTPIAVQEGCIQISFLCITAIANARGVDTAAAVGIVEKLIGFFFLVPSAFGSATSALAARYMGAGEDGSARKILDYAIRICIGYGSVLVVICVLFAEPIVGLFAGGSTEVIRLGTQYLHSYIIDCVIAGVHFCYSGFFNAYGKSWISFLHNIISIIAVRIPGAYLASIRFPDTLFPMGLAAPAGSLLSVFICIAVDRILRKAWEKSA